MTTNQSEDEGLREFSNLLEWLIIAAAKDKGEAVEMHKKSLMALISQKIIEAKASDIRLHREEAHLAGRIEEAMSIKNSYTKRYGTTSILNNVLDKRLRRYRKQIETVFTEHKATLTQWIKE